jgi:indole-3-glycerol phosphate synthase
MLSKILRHKEIEIQTLKVPDIERGRKIYNPLETLKIRPIIAEVKKASPSLGDINVKVDAVSQAKKYEAAGAGAISVLTDEKFFKGSFNFLKDVAGNVNLPVLCKDFIISEKQIDMAYRFGADVILLIVKALREKDYKRLFDYAKSLGLYILTEIHEISEMKIVEKYPVDILGVNSRNLETLEIDKQKAAKIIKDIDNKYFKIAESGIDCVEDAIMFKSAGAKGFLIGSYLMKSNSPEDKIKEIYRGIRCL